MTLRVYAHLMPSSQERTRKAVAAIFDTARNDFQVYRVPYDIAQTQAQIQAAGLPDVLGARLSIGK